MATEKKSFDELIEKIEEYQEEYGDYFTYGKLDGDDFVIIESWEQLNSFNAFLNGYGAKFTGSEPFVPRGKTLNDVVLELTEELKKDPENWNLKGRKQNALDYFLYSQYLAANKIEDPISLDSYDCESGFSDQYSTCYDCNAILRTSPDSYCWQPDFIINEDGFICSSCLQSGNYNDYFLEEYKNTNKAIPSIVSPDSLGLVQVNENSFENGLHSGQNDSPDKIIKSFNEHDIDVWFTIESSQFYVSFDCFVKEENLEKAKGVLSGTSTYQGYDNVENLKKALSQAPICGSSKDGIAVTTCDVSTGTATTKVVSHADFVEKGIK